MFILLVRPLVQKGQGICALLFENILPLGID